MTVSDDDQRPRYVQVGDILRRSIERGGLKAGQRVPSARDLAKRYGVSLMTVQKAIDLLKSDGLLVGVPGRGTFLSSERTVDNDDRPSAEYVDIMRHITELRSAFRAQMDTFEERMTSLEQAVADLPRQQRQDP